MLVKPKRLTASQQARCERARFICQCGKRMGFRGASMNGNTLMVGFACLDCSVGMGLPIGSLRNSPLGLGGVHRGLRRRGSYRDGSIGLFVCTAFCQQSGFGASL